MNKLLVLFVLLALGAELALAQTAGRAAQAKAQITTARIHIDGFLRSKSGAI